MTLEMTKEGRAMEEKDRYVPVEHGGNVEGVGERQTGHTRINVVPLQYCEEGRQ